MSDPELIEVSTISIYVRTHINEVGLYPAPQPVLEAPQASEVYIDVTIRNLSEDKTPLDLSGKHVRFLVRTRKYPESEDDIVIDLKDGDGITIDSEEDGMITIHLTSADLNIPPTDYWYDLIVSTDETFTEQSTRQPIGKFRVLA